MSVERPSETEVPQVLAESFILGGALLTGISAVFFMDEFIVDGNGHSSISEIMTHVPDFGIRAGIGVLVTGIAMNVGGRLWRRSINQRHYAEAEHPGQQG